MPSVDQDVRLLITQRSSAIAARDHNSYDCRRSLSGSEAPWSSDLDNHDHTTRRPEPLPARDCNAQTVRKAGIDIFKPSSSLTDSEQNRNLPTCSPSKSCPGPSSLSPSRAPSSRNAHRPRPVGSVATSATTPSCVRKANPRPHVPMQSLTKKISFRKRVCTTAGADYGAGP